MTLSISNRTIFLFAVFLVVVIASFSFIIVPALAQESSSSSQAQQYLNRRVEIWALFYRGMVAAFVVGAVVQGSIIYVAWRFREGHKKNRIPAESGAGDYR
jgi:heme/copper-type cytochrome/quinol oxidase subunit 2